MEPVPAEPTGLRPAREPHRGRPSLAATALERLRGLSVLAVVAAALVLVAVLGTIDYLAEQDLSFLVFYLVPVFLVTLRAGLWAGLTMSVAGTAVWFLANADLFRQEPGELIPFWNLAETLGVFAFFTCILSALVDALDEERRMSRFDARTGLVNRRHFLELLEDEIARSRRFRRPFSLVYAALVDPEAAPDDRGRAAGDAPVAALAGLLLREAGAVNIATRLGPAEFALLLPESGYDDARAAMANLRSRLAEAAAANGWPVAVTTSAVTATAPRQSAEEMIGMADRLAYANRAAGAAGAAHHVIDGQEVPPAPRG